MSYRLPASLDPAPPPSALILAQRLGIESLPALLPENHPDFALSFVERYRFHPDAFARECFGIDPDAWQRDFLFDVADGARRISVRSGHGVGKSLSLSLAALHALLTSFPCRVVCTAPTFGQLFNVLMTEIKSLLARAPKPIRDAFEVKSDAIVFLAAPNDCFLSARTASKESSEALQGTHASGPTSRVLLIADEASGVPDAVFNAAGGSMSSDNATLLCAGNPTRLLNFFADSFRRSGFADRFVRYHIGKGTSPRVTDIFAAEVASRYGEESNEYRVRVLGEFPTSDTDSLIPLDLAESAMARDISTPLPAQFERVWGLDPARSGDDHCALVERVGPVCTWIERWKSPDLMSTAGRVMARWEATPLPERPKTICVDVIGLGAGVVDRLRELGLPVRGINVAETPSVEGRFMLLRDELWWKLKEWLQSRAVRLPKDEMLLNELIGPKYGYASNGRLKVESKKDMRQRGMASPDIADALCLTFAVRVGILFGAKERSTLLKPLRRTGAVC